MSVDIETIGVAVDSSGVVKGTRDLDKFGASANKASKDADNLGKNSESSFSKVASAARSMSLAVGASVAVVVGVGSALLKTAVQAEKLNNTLKFSTGSAANATKEIDYLRSITNQLGLEFNTTASAYAKFSAAAKGTNLEGQKTRDIFESIAKASTTLGLSADETGGALKAIEQIISKGTVSAEELRGQLGERLPGAFQIAARAMGVTTQELGKMLEQGQLVSDVFLPKFAAELTKTLGDSPESAAGSAQAQLNRLTNAWTEFKKTIAESGVITIVVRLIEGTAGALKFVTTGLSDISGDKNWQKTKLSQLMQMREDKNFQFFSEAQINSDINKLRRSLGIAQQFDAQTNPSTGLNPNGIIAPNFGVTKADGTGGYDARVNNQKEIDEQKKNYQKLVDDKKQKETQFYNYKSRLQDELKNKEDELTTSAYKTIAKLEKEEYERKQKYMELLQKQANANFDEAQKKVKELNDEAERIGETLSRSLTDALYRGFESGKSFLQNFIDTLKNTFKTLILQPIIRFLVDSSGITKVLAAFGGAFSGNAVAGEGGGFMSSISNGFSSITDIFKSGNSSIVSSIQDLGTFLSTGNGGLGDTIGGFLGQYSSQIADGFGYFGAALQLAQGNIGGALGAGIGTFFGGPIGGAIGSFLGGALGGLFGGGLPPRVTESRSASSSGGVTSFFNGTDPGKRKLGAASALDGLNEAFINNLNTIFGAFGVENDISANSLLTKKKNTRSRFNANVNGQSLGYAEFNLGKKGTIQEAFNVMMETVLGSYTVKAIQASSLPAGIKQFFDGLTKKEDVAETINTLISMKNALVDLPPIFNAVRNAIDTTAYTTSLAQLQAQFAATQTFVDLFYSGTEKFDIFTQQLVTQFDALNQTIPTSRDQYRALVESINVVDEATRNQFNGLIALAPAMNEYFNLLSQQADGINEVNQALADGLNQNLFSTFADYASARARVSAGVDASQFMARVQNPVMMNEAMANEIKQLRAENAETKQILQQIASNTAYTAKTNKQWNGDGLPETRVY